MSDVQRERVTPPTLAPLWRNRDFLILRTGEAVSVLGSRVSLIAFPLAVLAFTGSAAWAGTIGFFNTLPQLLFNLPAGVYIDRWDRKRIMILCDAGRLVAMGSVALTLALGHPSVAQFAAVAFIEGSLAVLFTLAEGAAVPRIVPKEQLPLAYAQNETVNRGSMLLGQPLGGILYSLGAGLPFLVDAVSFGASVVSLLFIRTPFQAERAHIGRHSFRSELMAGLRWVWHQPFLRVSTCLVAGTNFVFAANYLVVIVLAQHRHATASSIGLIFGLSGLGGLVGALLSGWLTRRLSLAQIVIGVNWVWAILWPLFAVAPGWLALGGIYGLMVFAGPVWNVALGSYIRTLVPDEFQARVGGVLTLIAWGTIPLGSAIAGPLLQTIGPIATVLVVAVVMLVLAIIGTLSPNVRAATGLAHHRISAA
jgi:MFS family permease